MFAGKREKHADFFGNPYFLVPGKTYVFPSNQYSEVARNAAGIRINQTRLGFRGQIIHHFLVSTEDSVSDASWRHFLAAATAFVTRDALFILPLCTAANYHDQYRRCLIQNRRILVAS